MAHFPGTEDYVEVSTPYAASYIYTKTKVGSCKWVIREKFGVTNTSRGIISARSNILNSRIQLNVKSKELVLHAEDGTKKIYRQALHAKVLSEGLSLYAYVKSNPLKNIDLLD